MLENIVVQTNLYAQQSITVKPDPAWYNTSREEMRAFLGIKIYMGIVVQPEQHFKCQACDVNLCKGGCLIAFHTRHMAKN